ncbi:MAG: hypothetical protein M1816_006993 [Peltula sp. TS41687]|nr:MAG: hypothetical protein M1816_006993 [Peltula sp. TS41687]
MPGKSGMKAERVDGSMESLRQMAGTRRFEPAKLDTLPFERLKLRLKRKKINRETSRRSICAECMAHILRLFIEETYPPGARPIQEPMWGEAFMPVRKIKWTVIPRWVWRTQAPNREGGRIDAGNLAYSCDQLLTDLPKPTIHHHQCYGTDFDPSLRDIYDPYNQILVVQKDMGEERPRNFQDYSRATSDSGLEGQQNHNTVPSSLTSVLNKVKTGVTGIRDGISNGMERTLNALGKAVHGPSSQKYSLPQGLPVAPIPHGQFITP